MGINIFGAPRETISFLKSQHLTQVFVETGTFLGDTAAWAASVFDKVVTIEGSKSHYESAANRLSSFKHVQCLCGDSRTVLAQVLGNIWNERTVFWLDAHWMPGSFGDSGECPIIEELGLIREMSDDYIILIDDARLFLAPPPRPHHAADWPPIDKVMDALKARNQKSRYTVVYDDVIISVPSSLKDAALKFFRDKVTKEMATASSRPNILQRFIERLTGSL